MTMSHEWNAQVAVYEVAANDPVLATQVTGVLDDVPENQPYPYIAIGESTTGPDHGLIATGESRTVVLHVWSIAAGMREVKQIFDSLYRLFDNTEYPVSGTQMVSSRVEFAETMRDVDNRTRHGICRVRLLTYSTDAS